MKKHYYIDLKTVLAAAAAFAAGLLCDRMLGTLFLCGLFPLAILAAIFSISKYRKNRYLKDLTEALAKAESAQDIPSRKEAWDEVTGLLSSARAPEEREYAELLQKVRAVTGEDYAQIIKDNNDRLYFVEQWTHDIKNPLAAIRLVCENNPIPQRESIFKELDIAEGYVAKTLSASKYLATNTMYSPRWFSLKSLVNSVIIRNKGRLIPLRIRINIHDVDFRVYWVEKWLEFILNQMVQNSINYRRDNEPQIEICTERRKNRLCLVVADNGVGIKEEELPRIFDENFIGTNEAGNRNASGVGLYLSMRMAQKGNATIEAESEYGSYTRMRIVFPVFPEERSL